MKGKLWDNCSDLFTVASWHYYPPAAMLSAAWNEEIKMDSLMSQKKKKKSLNKLKSGNWQWYSMWSSEVYIYTQKQASMI